MTGPKYVPPQLRQNDFCDSLRFERFGKDQLSDIQKHHLVKGRHMNYQGGSWNQAKQTERANEADLDWRKYDREGIADGYYWVVYTGGTGSPCALIGCHRIPNDYLFTFRSFFADATSEQLKINIIHAALRQFRDIRPDQCMVWSHIRGMSGTDNLYSRAGFDYMSEKKIHRPDGRFKMVGIYVFDVSALTVRLSPAKIGI